MAKKVLTPEQQEIKAMKKAKKSQNWTKFWAIVLALALTLCIAFAGQSQGKKNVPETTPAAGEQGSGSGSGSNDNPGYSSGDSYVDPGSSDSSSDGTDTPNDPADPATPGADSSDDKSDAPAADNTPKSEAEVAALINKVTGEAVAQKVGYDWKRDCSVKDIDVGRLTSGLNKLIPTISKNPDDNLNTVVGGFLGNGSKSETVPKGKTLDTMEKTKDDGSKETVYHGSSYTLKATQLKAEDIKNLKISGNTYSFDIPDCSNPARNGNTGLSRFTNDIVVREEVESELAGFTDQVTVPALTANYKNIKASVTIKDGKLVELKYSFYADAQLDVKMLITVKGTGNLTTSATYSNFKY
ncbi:MAG: hypothetical protein J1F24_03230 [Oscillospiraceae bacterium]|nr:hypothetical protein [Oscillospiraceae bacterium]